MNYSDTLDGKVEALLVKRKAYLAASEVYRAVPDAAEETDVCLALGRLKSAGRILRITAPVDHPHAGRYLYGVIEAVVPANTRARPGPRNAPIVREPRVRPSRAKPDRIRYWTHTVQSDGTIRLAGHDGLLITLSGKSAAALRTEVAKALRVIHGRVIQDLGRGRS